VVAKIKASNLNGWSAYSPVNVVGVTIETEPLQMTGLVKNIATSTSQIVIDWTSPNNGGSSITSYGLWWNSGSGSTYTSLVGEVGPYTSLTYTITLGIVSGTSYNFKIRA
jgi:hypothetical protein